MNQQEQFIKKRRTAACITIIYIFLSSLLCILENMKIIPVIFLVACIGVRIFLFILVLIVWLVCGDAYIATKIETKKEAEGETSYVWDVVGIGIVFVLGFITLYYFLDTIYYLASEWKIINGLIGCIIWKICNWTGWLLLWIFSFKIARYMSNTKKVVRNIIVLTILIVLVIASVYITHVQNDYILQETESVWMRKMIEYYDENGMGPEVPPFSGL